MLNTETRDRLLDAQRLLAQGRREEAETLYLGMVDEAPNFVFPRRKLMELMRQDGRHEEALDQAREIFVRQPEPDNEYTYATFLLAAGRYAEGWAHYEARSLLRMGGTRPAINSPEWRGQPVGSLLVWDEQGAGDTFQFARFLPELRRRGVQTHLLARPQVCAVLAHLPDTIIPGQGQVKLPPHDAWLMLASLPYRLGVTLETLPAQPYLAAEPATIPGKRIGVVGVGNPRHLNDSNRSLPASAWAQLRSLPGAVSLQPGDELPLKDYAETARVIAGLDLVITVDTSVAHLAGAMGKACWVLLPAEHTDWRWLLERTDSPWYPSVRLFRQPRPGDWASVLRDLAAALGERGLGAA